MGAVGQLQMEVVKYRLKSEYGVEMRFESAPYQYARWVTRKDGGVVKVEALETAYTGLITEDARGRIVILFDGDWAIRATEKLLPDFIMAETAHGVIVRDAKG